MKMKYNFISKFEKFLSNKTLLNIVVVISFLNIIGFVMFNKTIAIVYFILIGLLTSMFSKNMVIVLLTPLLLVNLFVIGSNKYYSREGLENKDDATTTTTKTAPTPKNVKKTTSSTTTSSSSSSSTNQGLPITPLEHVQDNVQNTTTDESNVDESFEVGRGKKNSQGYNIDYASTVEDAYDELNKILGSDGIKRLTNDTQNLMKQQLQLAESMKSMKPLIDGMTPLMEQAKGLLGNMGDNGNLNNLANMAKQFTASLGNNSAK